MEIIHTKKRLLPYRSFLLLLNWLFWNCLAVTTAFMVASAADQPLRDNVPPEWYSIALSAIIAAVYGMVDWGLGGKIRAWIRDRMETKKPNQKNEQEIKQYRLLNRISWMIFLFLTVRIFATGLSSIWAGGEISDAIHSSDPTEVYRKSIEQNNVTNATKLASADKEYDDLKASENSRIAKVSMNGDKAIARAISSGNKEQRDMYRTNPSFFNSLSPTSPWTPGNRKFIDRINAAKKAKSKAIEAEKQKTEAARQLKYSTTQDTSASAFSRAMSIASTNAVERQESRRNRHTWVIILFDWLCLGGGIICSYLIVMIDVATKKERDGRSLSYIFSIVGDRITRGFWNILENITGLDIDGDGEIGTTGKSSSSPSATIPTAVSPGAPMVHYLIPTPSEVKTERRPIGFDIGRSTSDPTAKPKKMITPLANVSKPLANDFSIQELTLLDADTHMSAYKDARKNYFAWKGYRDNKAVSPNAKASGQSRMNEYLQEMVRQEACLNALGVLVPERLKEGLDS